MNDAEIDTHRASPIHAEPFRRYLRQNLCVPASTYRIQFHNGFGFRDAASIVPYLSRLGVDACYCSPYLQARPKTTHGYDICDYGRMHEELGTDADYESFTAALAQAKMGQIIDFVPNHMGGDPVDNRWWRDVLENGQASPYVRFFDIDWDPVKVELRGKVLLPVLDDHYGLVLERGDLKLAWSDGRLHISNGPMHFPVEPKQYSRVLQYRLDELAERIGQDNPDFVSLRNLLQEFYDLPGCSEVDLAAERLQMVESVLVRLQRLVQSSPAILHHIEENIDRFNGTSGVRESFDLLHELLEAQPYRLAFWKGAHDEINYRRFFHIAELVGLRMEDAAVFEATHSLILKLIGDERVSGIRLDHLDGLFDPSAYLETLQDAVIFARATRHFGSHAMDSHLLDDLRTFRRQQDFACNNPFRHPLYLVAEKILSLRESLPSNWPLHGSSGYDFMNDLNRLFVDTRNAQSMREIYERFTGDQQSYAEVVEECKRLMTQQVLASELKMLARELNRISELDRRTRDYTLDSLREAIREVVVAFPVYRTYIDGSGIDPADRKVVNQAISRAIRRNPSMSPSVFSFLRQVLLLEGTLTEEERSRRLKFVMKFQQYTGPVEAKGVEDTAFYRYNVLLSLNEVGGKPDRFGGTVDAFHESNQTRLREWPCAMLATATHDNKRGEDARARINVLSEIPQEWERQVKQWQHLHAVHRTTVEDEPAPAAADEFALYQTLLGAWPAQADFHSSQPVPRDFVERIQMFLLKAAREANRHTGWMHPIAAYDDAVTRFVRQVLTGSTVEEFLKSFLPFHQHVARWGMLNSLSQLVLKIVAPGVPDFYQGTELWDLNLVDPDNRRPVDYQHRIQLLTQLEALLPDSQQENRLTAVTDLFQHWHDGRIKMFLTLCGLRLRRRYPELFLQGEYLPLATEPFNQHVIASARWHADRFVIAIAPRLITHLLPTSDPLHIEPDAWRGSALRLPMKVSRVAMRNIFTGERVALSPENSDGLLPLATALKTLPVALLISVN